MRFITGRVLPPFLGTTNRLLTKPSPEQGPVMWRTACFKISSFTSKSITSCWVCGSVRKKLLQRGGGQNILRWYPFTTAKIHGSILGYLFLHQKTNLSRPERNWEQLTRVKMEKDLEHTWRETAGALGNYWGHQSPCVDSKFPRDDSKPVWPCLPDFGESRWTAGRCCIDLTVRNWSSGGPFPKRLMTSSGCLQDSINSFWACVGAVQTLYQKAPVVHLRISPCLGRSARGIEFCQHLFTTQGQYLCWGVLGQQNGSLGAAK